MKIETWKLKDGLVQVPILDDDEIEKNEDIKNDLEDTQVIETIGEVNE